MKATLTTGLLSAVLRSGATPVRRSLIDMLPPDLVAHPQTSGRLVLEESTGPYSCAWLAQFVPAEACGPSRGDKRMVVCALALAEDAGKDEPDEAIRVALIESALPSAAMPRDLLSTALGHLSAVLRSGSDKAPVSSRDAWLPHIVSSDVDHRPAANDVTAVSEVDLVRQLPRLQELFAAGAGLVARHEGLRWQVFRDRTGLPKRPKSGFLLLRAESALKMRILDDEALQEFRGAISSGRLLSPTDYADIANSLYLPDEGRKVFVAMTDRQRTSFIGSLVVAAQLDARTGLMARSLLRLLVPPLMANTYTHRSFLFRDTSIAEGLTSLFMTDIEIYRRHRKAIVERLLARKAQLGMPLDRKGLVALVGKLLAQFERVTGQDDDPLANVDSFAVGLDLLVHSMGQPTPNSSSHTVLQFRPHC